jgi:hypothetical protein
MNPTVTLHDIYILVSTTISFFSLPGKFRYKSNFKIYSGEVEKTQKTKSDPGEFSQHNRGLLKNYTFG